MKIPQSTRTMSLSLLYVSAEKERQWESPHLKCGAIFFLKQNFFLLSGILSKNFCVKKALFFMLFFPPKFF